MNGRVWKQVPAAALTVAITLLTASAWAQAPAPVYVVPGPSEISTLYADGSQVAIDTSERWRVMCSSGPNSVTTADLARFADEMHASLATGQYRPIDGGARTGGLNIIYNVDGTVPAEAVAALAVVEAYLEPIFSDPITVEISVHFGDLGNPSIIGATSSSFVNSVTYTNSRNGLVNGKDSTDVIQDYLPTTATIPVRFSGSSATITNQSVVDWTRANYRATVGTSSGNCASMTFNTQFAPTFDYDPTNGVPSNRMSFVDVAMHETGHALGFVSDSDYGGGITSLDLFRFQRTDGTQDYNPDTYAEFTTCPRLVSYNSPDDDANSDVINTEYRMSDGNPYQGSHFREQSSPWIGLMDPAFANGETHYPNYFSAADITMFDAIGYNYPPCQTPAFTQQPGNYALCSGATVQFTVAVDITTVTYQWRVGSTALVDDGVHISGAHTPTLTITNVVVADSNPSYNCQVTNTVDNCVAGSSSGSLVVWQSPYVVTPPPATQNLNAGQTLYLNVVGGGAEPLSYRWRYNGVELQNGVTVYGADTASLIMLGLQNTQAGFYDCVVSNPCSGTPSTPCHVFVYGGYGAGRGDLNCDNQVSFGDINPFVLAMVGGEDGYYVSFPDCDWFNADVSANGSVGFDDINPFVTLLTGG
jgi:hypothetical protein